MTNKLTIAILLILFCTLGVAQTVDAEKPILLIRCDDIGMCHSVNVAAEQIIASGLPFSASVMFACPWYQEAVEILRAHPEVAVGVHLTLNAEWKNYRWGPVVGWKSAKSLTDSCGYFFPSRVLFFANKPRIKDIENELRAQISRALQSGLRIDYIDYHMGTVVSTEPLRRLVEQLANEFHLGISRYFGEQDVRNVYSDSVSFKSDSLLKTIQQLQSDHINLLVCHIGQDTPEMAAMVDLNSFGLVHMSRHRQAELDILVSANFRQQLLKKQVILETYNSLIIKKGLISMKRPINL